MNSPQFQRAKLFAETYLASMDTDPRGEEMANETPEEIVVSHGHLQKVAKQARAKAKQVGEEVYALIEMAEMHCKNRWKMDFLDLVLVTVCLAYVAAPVDFIPDLLPTIGYMDDAALVAFTVETLRENIANFQAWKQFNMVEYQAGKEEMCCSNNPASCVIL